MSLVASGRALLSLAAISALTGCPIYHEKPDASPGWYAKEFGQDCSGGDIGSSFGSASPDPAYCESRAQNDDVAICWDQGRFMNPMFTGPWCTYKMQGITSATCQGGPNPGLVMICIQY